MLFIAMDKFLQRGVWRFEQEARFWILIPQYMALKTLINQAFACGFWMGLADGLVEVFTLKNG